MRALPGKGFESTKAEVTISIYLRQPSRHTPVGQTLPSSTGCHDLRLVDHADSRRVGRDREFAAICKKTCIRPDLFPA
jgi:hypothetical protein